MTANGNIEPHNASRYQQLAARLQGKGAHMDRMGWRVLQQARLAGCFVDREDGNVVLTAAKEVTLGSTVVGSVCDINKLPTGMDMNRSRKLPRPDIIRLC